MKKVSNDGYVTYIKQRGSNDYLDYKLLEGKHKFKHSMVFRDVNVYKFITF